MSDPRWKSEIVRPDTALAGRSQPIRTADTHFVTGNSIKTEVPAGMQEIILGLGCFWGAERVFWQTPGVWHTAVGYAGGTTPNPTYEEACSGGTGHFEAVRVVFDPAVITLPDLLKVFWESHDPTQGMRQGNDRGTHYRSAILTTNSQQSLDVENSRASYQAALDASGKGGITTEIGEAGPFYYAEDYHQQFLAKNPDGYCGLGGTGVVCPIHVPAST
ncbi:MAG: peptide-methionine (S)-S-oxide reductase MsrA [Maricaulis sp.]|jgi:peptide-methionine (S)-S-oxide reductase|nr:peptide-methionine (S)-S-oxide reductase MsrA [Maricaulis sp.]MDG2044533.1 peptide-methionine (S)-S-oxide reductase MsrA [Maricaulis sp.]